MYALIRFNLHSRIKINLGFTFGFVLLNNNPKTKGLDYLEKTQKRIHRHH
jgi:hypothetical protein